MRLHRCLLLVVLVLSGVVARADLLPGWNDGPARQRIERFVAAVTDPTSPDYVPPAERIAVFDNDGTLWTEQPMYFQLAFVFDRIREMAPQHPEWKTTQPFRAVLEGDMKGLHEAGEAGLAKLVMATHGGLTTEEFQRAAERWSREARHPRFDRPYPELAYAPMRQLLDYLRANGFRTFIVSGGGAEFIRAVSQPLYGIPPDQVIGSTLRTKYQVRDGQGVVVQLPELEFVDDKSGKPVGLHRHIGRRPILAFGNSDGDFEMLEYTTTGPGPRLGLILHHDDADREYAYDRDSSVGRLARGLDEAAKRGWTVVSMKNDWRVVYPEPARAR
jgi:phosphoserine phosphatase